MSRSTQDAHLSKKIKLNPPTNQAERDNDSCAPSIAARNCISTPKVFNASTQSSTDRCECTICDRHRRNGPLLPLDSCHCGICNRYRTWEDECDDIKKIPMEIWSTVWAYLEPPDLNNVSRSCRFFHTSVSPTLYRRIIITDPSQLLYGLDHRPGSDRICKLEMLSSIRHLHFVYDFIKVPENQEDEWIFGFRLIDYWENIPNLSRVIEGYEESIKQIERFHLNDVHHHSLQLGLFRKLKTVSFGYEEKLFFPNYRSYDQFRQIEKQKQRQHQRQIIISPNQARAYSKKEVESISSSWMENIQSLIKPLHICREVVNGPLGFGFSSSSKINSSPRYGSVPHTYTLHYSSRRRMSDQVPNYIYGTLNRLILEDVVLEDFGGEAEEDEDEDDERFRAVRVFNWICDITMSQFIPERNTKSSSSMMSHNGKTIVPDTTRIRVYSTMDWKEINEGRKLLLIDPIYGPIVNTDRSISMRQPVDIDDTDTPTPRKPVCQLQSPKLVENGVVIELMRMKDAGTCPACGAHGEFGRCPTI